MADNVNHPSHYETGKFECIEVMIETQGKEAVRCFCLCNALKYLYRHTRKNGIEDIKKATWYLSKYIELSEVNVMKNKQKWTSVEEALPKEDGEYLTYHDGYYMLLQYSTKHKLFNVTEKPQTAITSVTHWMPIPEAPKGEQQ
jgi:hypothetical protein